MGKNDHFPVVFDKMHHNKRANGEALTRVDHPAPEIHRQTHHQIP